MVCVARFPNVGRMGSGGKGGGIVGPGFRSTVGANRIRPPHAFEPGCPSAPLGVRYPRMGQDHGKAREASLLPLFPCPKQNLSGNATASYAAWRKILCLPPWK